MKIILWLLSLLFAMGTIIADDITPPQDEKLLLGAYTWEEWSINSKWADTATADYHPKPEIIQKLKKASQNKTIEFQLFVGNWCKDSESEMPKIMQVYILMDLGNESIGIWGLDRNKQNPYDKMKRSEPYKITKLPTLVILSKGDEIGRILEFPKKSWEEDILEIIKDN